MNKAFITFLSLIIMLPCLAQKHCEISPLIRELIDGQNGLTQKKSSTATKNNRKICCFVKTDSNTDIYDLMEEVGGICHMKEGNLCIVTIPVEKLPAISTTKGVRRIEAKRSKNQSLNDLSRTVLKTESLHNGADPLPHPFKGKGTMLGIMDIGFDLTHPNFLDSEGKLRIQSLWDQLDIAEASSDSEIPIGKIHKGSDHLLAYAHSADGKEQTHGTHTLGSAAGSGYGSPYIGMAPEAEICCVANATENNANLIPDSLDYIYTYALDALGFKYLFDCADAMGKPCVITFSEGSIQDFKGDDILFYEALEKLVGPGHIIVSAAGNSGQGVNYLHKKSNDKTVGTGLLKWSAKEATMPFIIDSSAPLNLKLIAYGKNSREGINDTITLRLDNLHPEQQDTLVTHFGTDTYKIIYTSYPNCYDASRFAYEVTIVGETKIGYAFDVDLLLEDIGYDADTQLFSTTGELISNSHGKRCDATNEANIVSPASAPCVICVGATSYRTEITNYLGYKKYNNLGENGEKATYSSVGPTFDSRIKPDVMAPGTNVLSSYSSYYLENNPGASDITWDVEHFKYNGRTYAWNSNTGTSMACPLAAGIIALWLEACPTLTPQDVLEVIAKTSNHHDTTLSYPNNRYGYGEIDAFAGLMHILEFDKIEEVSMKPARNVRISRHDDAITVHLATPSASSLPCNIYSTDGRKVYSFVIPANTQSHTITFHAPKGHYALQIGKLGSGIFTF